MHKKIGFWKEFRRDFHPSLLKDNSLKKRNDLPPNNVLEYLQNGIWLGTLRTIFYCPITEESLGPPSVYTDGEWFWTTEYIYYFKNYMIDLPKDFLERMEANNFIPPREDEFSEESLIKLENETNPHV